MVILNRYKYIIVTVLMIISILSINVIKPKAELIDSINLINNGSFSNGITGWIKHGNVELDTILVPHSMKFTTTKTSFIFKDISCSQTDKLYIRGKLYISSASRTFDFFSIRDYGSYTNTTSIYVDHTKLNQWQTISTIVNGKTEQGIRLCVGNSNIIVNGVYYADEIMVINLTQVFGAGNEPNIMDCNEIYREYFEGLKRQDIKPHDVTENAHKTFIQMIISTMLVPVDMLKKYKVGNQISLFDIFIGMIILVILTKTILKIGGKISNDVR